MQELIKAGIITPQEYAKAKAIQKQKGGLIGEILVDMNAVDVNKFIGFIKTMTD